jgi:uncharacterized protein (TIGR00255 family)
MTGFGHAGFEVDGLAFEIEIRTVNHRHLDVRARLPRTLSREESGIKACVQQTLQRGRVDVNVSLVRGVAAEPELAIDSEAFGALVRTARELGRAHGLDDSLRVAELLGLPGVLRVVEREPDPADLSRAFEAAFGSALEAVDAMRASEGEALEREIRLRLDGVAGLLDKVQQRADGVVDAARTRLRKRADQLQRETGLLDEARLHQEVVIAADRLDIVEEAVRLESHVEQFRALLAESGPGVAVGRRLDFLLQEMGRETNTIGSKGSDTEIAHLVVDLKTELERIREQVQNIE